MVGPFHGFRGRSTGGLFHPRISLISPLRRGDRSAETVARVVIADREAQADTVADGVDTGATS